MFSSKNTTMETKKSYTALIILVYNNKDNIVHLVESVEYHNTALIKYIIVDNGSTENGITESVSDFLRQKFGNNLLICSDDYGTESIQLPYVTFVQSRHNGGFSAGNNKGLKLAYLDDEIDNVFVINDDIIFVDDIISRLCHYLHSLPNAGMICPIHLSSDKEVDLDCARLLHGTWHLILNMALHIRGKNVCILRLHPEYVEKEYIEIQPPIGPCILFTKKSIHTIGGYDENTFLYFEEYILYSKFQKLHLKNYAIPSCKLIHVGSTSTGKVKQTIIRNIYLDSCYYYLTTYCKLNFMQKVSIPIFYSLGKIRTRLASIVSNYN